MCTANQVAPQGRLDREHVRASELRANTPRFTQGFRTLPGESGSQAGREGRSGGEGTAASGARSTDPRRYRISHNIHYAHKHLWSRGTVRAYDAAGPNDSKSDPTNGKTSHTARPSDPDPAGRDPASRIDRRAENTAFRNEVARLDRRDFLAFDCRVLPIH